MRWTTIGRRATATATVAVALTLTWGTACQSSSDGSDEVIVSEPGQQSAADSSPVDGNENTEAEETPSDSQQQRTTPERSIQRAEEQLDGRPPPQAPVDDASSSANQRPQSSQPEETSVSPEEISEGQTRDFAAAYIEVMDLKAEYQQRLETTSDPSEMQTLQQQLTRETTEAVESNGLDIQKFNAIADLLEQNDELRDQIQSSINSLVQ